jgi:hypothetical protein
MDGSPFIPPRSFSNMGYRPFEKMQRRRKPLACLKRYIGGENH